MNNKGIDEYIIIKGLDVTMFFPLDKRSVHVLLRIRHSSGEHSLTGSWHGSGCAVSVKHGKERQLTSKYVKLHQHTQITRERRRIGTAGSHITGSAVQGKVRTRVCHTGTSDYDVNWILDDEFFADYLSTSLNTYNVKEKYCFV